MVDIAAISAAVASLKTATDIAKSIRELSNSIEVQGKIAELQTEILAAQSSALAANADQFALLERVRELEKQMAELEAWDAEKQRYELADFGGGTFAYLLKPSMSNGEPEHRLCPRCYQQRKKSILQFMHKTGYSQDVYVCSSCKHEFKFGVRIEPPMHRSSYR